jgi:hypothetical protein
MGDSIVTVSRYCDGDTTEKSTAKLPLPPLDVVILKSPAVTPLTAWLKLAMIVTRSDEKTVPEPPTVELSVNTGGEYARTNGDDAALGGEIAPEPFTTRTLMLPPTIGGPTVRSMTYRLPSDPSALAVDFVTLVDVAETRTSSEVKPTIGALKLTYSCTNLSTRTEFDGPTDDDTSGTGGRYATTYADSVAMFTGEMVPDAPRTDALITEFTYGALNCTLIVYTEPTPRKPTTVTRAAVDEITRSDATTFDTGWLNVSTRSSVSTDTEEPLGPAALDTVGIGGLYSTIVPCTGREPSPSLFTEYADTVVAPTGTAVPRGTVNTTGAELDRSERRPLAIRPSFALVPALQYSAYDTMSLSFDGRVMMTSPPTTPGNGSVSTNDTDTGLFRGLTAPHNTVVRRWRSSSEHRHGTAQHDET